MRISTNEDVSTSDKLANHHNYVIVTNSLGPYISQSNMEQLSTCVAMVTTEFILGLLSTRLTEHLHNKLLSCVCVGGGGGVMGCQLGTVVCIDYGYYG